MIDPNIHVWLTYVSSPFTPATYLERALRKICRVTTIGPTLSELSVLPHDIETQGMPNMQVLLATLPVQQRPDLFVWIESGGRNLPLKLDALSCPKVCYLLDSRLHLVEHLEMARLFDYVFIAQLGYLEEFRKANPNSYWLPLACDPDLLSNKSQSKIHDICFVGSVVGETKRARFLQMLQSELPIHHEHGFGHERAEVFSSSRIVFNGTENNDLNMRFFEALSSGSLLLSDMACNSGQNELFRDGEDYACYNDANIVDVARFYLENEQLREQIAARGQALVHNAHTYHHRVCDLLEVSLLGKQDTLSPQQLRELSLHGVPEPYLLSQESARFNRSPRSFVIPVLDHSPASEYSIVTLLNDLEHILGDVIVIFNSEEMANELKGHPRITHYAIMKCNIGVARAWNIGLNIAETPTVFIINADLHITKETVETLENALWNMDRAACVGPQGSFFNFASCAFYKYFDKGTFGAPLNTDSVSGFLFCVKRELFENATLVFENNYTPCYFEEWDLALQVKKAGLKCYIVPTSGYDHHFSNYIRADRTVTYYGREEAAKVILLRNRLLFLNKWRGIARREGIEWLLESRWRFYALEEAHKLLFEGDHDTVAQLASDLSFDFPEDREIQAIHRFATLQASKMRVEPSKFQDIAGTHDKLADKLAYADVLFSSGQYQEAEEVYRELLIANPLAPGLHNSLATVLDRLDRHLEAVAHYTKALSISADFTVARFNLANTLKRLGNVKGAIENLQLVADYDPLFVEAWENLALCRLDEDDLAGATHCLEKVLAIDPGRKTARADLGRIYTEMCRYDEAIACFDELLQQCPDDAAVLNSKGIALQEMGDGEGAELCYKHALKVDPQNGVALNNLAALCRDDRRPDLALDYYEQALTLEPQNEQVLFNRGISRLMLGDYKHGWQDYEHRFGQERPVQLFHNGIPRWNGEPLAGKCLLVQSEQGYGDTLQFARYLPLLQRYGCSVVFECQDSAIKAALSGLSGIDCLLVRGEVLPHVDCQIPLLSLPLLFGTELDSIPYASGYLSADTDKVESWRRLLCTVGKGKLIGINWAGRRTRQNGNRAMRLENLRPLLDVSGVVLVSLQLGDEATEAAVFGGRLLDLSGKIKDFGDTAAILANLDLIITVDSAVAHLAGALGVPVWVMLKHAPDWRWLLDRSDTPWYSSIKLFRQQKSGEWDDVVTQIIKELRTI
jgi:tetratricopeptide (TPR) repeat protein